MFVYMKLDELKKFIEDTEKANKERGYDNDNLMVRIDDYHFDIFNKNKKHDIIGHINNRVRRLFVVGRETNYDKLI